VAVDFRACESGVALRLPPQSKARWREWPMSVSQCQQRSHSSSRRDNRKLASHKVAGLVEKLKYVLKGRWNTKHGFRRPFRTDKYHERFTSHFVAG